MRPRSSRSSSTPRAPRTERRSSARSPASRGARRHPRVAWPSRPRSRTFCAPRARPAGALRALRVVRDALRSTDAPEARAPETPLAPLLAELDALSRAPEQPTVEARALAELGHEGALDASWVAALLRERARLLVERLGDPRGALEALEGAARLQPGHALVATELVELAAAQDRFDVVERVVARFEAASRSPERAQVLALAQVAALGRGGHLGEALAALDASPGLKRAAGQPAVFGLRVALLARARDAQGLAAAFTAEGARAGGAAGARALVFAAAVRQWWADDPAGAEELYRRAIAAAPLERAAWDALESLLAAQGRWADLAELLEAALAEIVGAPGAAERELTLREELVALYRDDLHAPEKAFAHQKQLARAAPRDVRQRVRLHDLELLGGVDTSDVAEATAEEVESLRLLAAGADDPAVAAALKVEAARLLGVGAEIPGRREAAVRLLTEAAPDDVTGLGTALLEAAGADANARAAVVAEELESAMTEAPAEIVRALRFRLAHHHAAAGRYAEAIAALTPLRAEEDSLARAWSWDLARRSRDAILEVAVLSDEARARRGVLGAPADVELAYGEALERAGDASGAGAAFARALASAPSTDAALGMLRVAATTSTGPDATGAALAALQIACGDEPRVAAAAGREEALLRVASGGARADDLTAAAPPGASAVEVAEAAIVRWAAGITRGDTGVVAEALFDLGATMTAAGGEGAAAAVPLLARASARSRLAGRELSESLHKRIWRASHATRLATAIADLPVTPGEGWPSDRPDPRRARAPRRSAARSGSRSTSRPRSTPSAAARSRARSAATGASSPSSPITSRRGRASGASRARATIRSARRARSVGSARSRAPPRSPPRSGARRRSSSSRSGAGTTRSRCGVTPSRPRPTTRAPSIGCTRSSSAISRPREGSRRSIACSATASSRRRSGTMSASCCSSSARSTAPSGSATRRRPRRTSSKS